MVDIADMRSTGSDITADHMVVPTMEPSEIQEFFKGTTVFLTGATGFLGKLILEKLLRTCSDLQRVYLLIRPKKGKDIEARFQEIFDNTFFDRLRKERHEVFTKVRFIAGDCCQPNMGMSPEDLGLLKREVNVVFHCAATVRFDEKLRTAVNINVRATKDLLNLCKEMQNLRAAVYISTAFSHCPRTEIDEQFYDTPITGDKLLAVVDALDDNTLDTITPTLLNKWPNTYAFTKAIAEDVVRAEGKLLPLAVVRPSIVLATAKEPVTGWIDNFYGATGVLLGAAVGLLRTLHCTPENKADMVPADYVINSAIAAAWDIASIRTENINKEIRLEAEEKSREKRFESEIPIYNYVSCEQKPITWAKYMALAEVHCKSVPSPNVVWHYFFHLNRYKFVHLIFSFLFHIIPAIIVDTIAYCIGRKPLLMKAYKKIDKFSDVISYFSTRQWAFKNKNTQALWTKLNETDKGLFEFDISQMSWDQYFYTYVRGCRLYLLKDPLDTIPEGKKKLLKLQIAHYFVVSLLCFALYEFLMFMYRLVF